MSVARSILLFALAAVAEIGGAWMVWQGVREHRGLAWIGAGIAALAALFHNRQRRHSSLGMLSPIEYERRHQPSVRVQAS